MSGSRREIRINSSFRLDGEGVRPAFVRIRDVNTGAAPGEVTRHELQTGLRVRAGAEKGTYRGSTLQ